jgi:hypothetical protein
MSQAQVGIPNIPVYKYLSVDAGLSPSWEDRLEQLLTGRCFFSSPADFNDPFDCLPYFASPTTAEELTAWQEALIPPMAEAIRGDVPARFVENQIREKLAAHSLESLGEKLQGAASNFANGMGVFCLAACIDSILMWSHYASNHRGFAIQFSFSADVRHELLPMWKVRYQKQRPVVSDFYSSAAELPIADALAIKAEFWNYEQEWRCLIPDHARMTIDFDPSVISGLVLGAKCSETDAAIIRHIAEEKALPLHRMVANRSKFELSMTAC